MLSTKNPKDIFEVSIVNAEIVTVRIYPHVRD